MAGSVRIELNRAGVGEFLKSDDVRYNLHQRATAIAETAGPGFLAVSSVGRDRAYAIVRTDSAEARRAEAEDHVLLRSISAGAG